MNILLESRAFHPSVGGLEMMSHELAKAWQSTGKSVRIVTNTPIGEASEIEGLQVDRFPSEKDWWHHLHWADVFVQNGISLRSLYRPVLTGTPFVIIHQGLLSGVESPPVRTWLKRRATHLGANVAVSGAVADTIPGAVVRIPNTFRPVFEQREANSARRGLLFVGRLVSQKRASVAVEALRQLRSRGVDTTLTICGDGPEREALEQQIKRQNLSNRVELAGWADPETLARHYRSAKLLLVPSQYEAFGIVALEAIASGCPVVATRTGGLPEAVGDCGLLVPPNDPDSLADAVERALHPDVRQKLCAAMPAHVNRHRISRIATDYLHLLRRVSRYNNG